MNLNLFIYFYHFFKFLSFFQIDGLHCKKYKLKTYFLILHSSVFHKTIYTRQYQCRRPPIPISTKTVT